MPDPADKSDDLISELAKLMATPPQPAPAVQPLRPLAVEPSAAPSGPAPAPIPVVRIPGMDLARPVAAPAPAPVVIPAAAMASPQPEQRAPLTGAIRIPGMDQPVAASAPVGKLDFGRPPQAAVRSEPSLGGSIPSLSERIAARAAEAEAQRAAPEPAPVAPPIRFPELRTVSENRSFAQGPSVIPVMPPAAPQAPQQSQAGDFSFDFGFNAPAAASASTAMAAAPAPSADPIADLINADMDTTPAPARPGPVIPVLRTAAPPQRQPAAMPPAGRPIANVPIPLKPVAPPRPAESDRFAAAPSAGLNLRSAAAPRPLNRVAQPRVVEPEPEVDEADPMAEIESLIGEAVRVELNPGPVRVQAATPVSPRVEFEPEAEVRQEIHSEPAPVVPPLTTQFAPRRASLRDEGHAAAEDAILQATAASGEPVGRIEPAMADEGPYRRLKVRSQRSASSSSGLRQYVGMAVAGTLLLAAGLGLYWVLNMGHAQLSNGANAPQLTADATPDKTKPDPTAKPATDAANSPVLKQMEGVSQAPSAEQLVTTDQTAGQTNVADANAPAADSGENGLANRKVRTVTVRPDGTIVPGDDAVAGNEALAVDRPNVPLVPGSAPTDTVATNTASSVALPSGVGLPPAAIPDTQAADAAASVADAQPVIDPTQVAPVPMSFPVRGAPAGSTSALALASTPRSSVNAVVGAQTPNGPVNLLADNSALSPPASSPAPLAPAAQPAATDATAAPAAPGAAAYVQLASSLSAPEANAAVKADTVKYASAFGGASLVVQQASIPGVGTRWRVRLPASSLSNANAICAQIKALGGECFATNG